MEHKLISGAIIRPTALLMAVACLLLVAYTPAHVFRSTDDVILYQRYAQDILANLVELPQEYPPLAAGIFVLPQLMLPNYYTLGFVLLAMLATCLIVLIVDRLNRGGWWLLLYLALGAWGPLFFRFDIFVVLLTVLAFVAATRQRWLLAQVILALGVALKIYPLVLMPLIVLWQWRVTCRLPLSSLFGSAMLLVLVFGTMWLISPAQMVGMLHYHGDRPLELESIGASIAWLLGPVTFEPSFGSGNVISPLSSVIITSLTSASIVLLLVVYGCFLRGYLRPAAAWALTLLFAVATSKVFSTQYLLWPLPFVVLATGIFQRAMPRPYLWLWAVICALTSLIFPIGFRSMPVDLVMNLIVLRNVLWLIASGLALHFCALPIPYTCAQRRIESV
jgi:hypothetical protein